uniref:Response regulatory domain-containing protein n=1 Tax=Amphora coffeiformis TaxID=265554 RepID=A0A7S3P9V0_9STRA
MNSVDEVGQEADQLQLKTGQKWLYYTCIVAGNGYEPDQLYEAFQSYKQIHSDEDIMIIDEVTKIPISVSVELVRRLGGFMSCSSTPYDGTIFHFAVPVDAVATDTSLTVKRGENPILLSGPVLIVGPNSSEIEAQVKAEAKRLKIDAVIMWVLSGKEALAAYDGEVTPSVMIIDHQMSGMDGLETVTEVRRVEYMRKLQPSYIVSQTSDVTNNVAMILLQAGGNEVMVKPPPADFIPNLVCRFQVEKATIDQVLCEVMKGGDDYYNMAEGDVLDDDN